jgi:Right handed beta helix region
MKSRRGVLLILPAMLFLAAAPLRAGEAVADEAPCQGPAPPSLSRSITVPSRSYPTVQSAVCNLAPGGTVRIRPGDYEGQISIAKPVTLEGLGDGDRRPKLFVARPERLVPSDEARAVLNVLAGGSLNVSGVALQGGDAGIVARDDERGVVQSINVVDVLISNTGRGILHLSSGELLVKHVKITDVIGNAVSAFGPIGASLCGVTVAQSDFLSSGKVGLYVRNCQVAFDSSTVVGFLGGGLKAYGSSVSVTNSQFSFNRYFGLLFFNSSGSVEQTNVFVTDGGPNPADPDGPLNFGDGIAALTDAGAPGSPADVSIHNNFVFGSYKAAIAVYGAHATIGNTMMQNQAFDIENEVGLNGAPTINIVDDGGNLCDTKGNGYVPCLVVSSVGAPPAPIDDGA